VTTWPPLRSRHGTCVVASTIRTALPSDRVLTGFGPELAGKSRGAGKWRGGMSLRRRIRVLDHESRVFFGGSCWEEAPWGLEGGHSGGVCRVEYGEGTPRLSKRIGKVSAGQSIAIVTAGGGGFGPPDERDRALAERDLLEERISKPS